MNDLLDRQPTTTLARILFPLPALRRTPFEIFSWWESRRLTFNLIVGVTGLVTLSAVSLLGILAGLPFFAPWQAIVVYAIAANVCYTGGAVLEGLSVRLWKDDIAPVGPTLFRHGLVFSVGLTLLPIAVAGIGTVISLASRLLGALP